MRARLSASPTGRPGSESYIEDADAELSSDMDEELLSEVLDDAEQASAAVPFRLLLEADADVQVSLLEDEDALAI